LRTRNPDNAAHFVAQISRESNQIIMVLLRAALIAAVAFSVFCATIGSLDDGIDEHVDKVLQEMSAEDDAYGIEPESTLKKLKSGKEVDNFLKVSV
jgi:hypothetical protein